MKKPYFIAEIGVNFYDTARVLKISPMEAAKMYIREAKNAGCNAAKFQSYKANTIVSKNSPAYWDTSKEPTKTQYELFLKHDSFGRDEYEELAKYCCEIDIDFLSTPFDYASVDYLNNMVKLFKISSSDLSNLPFLDYIAKKGKPVYLSVGASYESEIDIAVRTLKNAGCNDICLLHCMLSYPTKFENANLLNIKRLKDLYPELKVGYSDHTLPDESMLVLSTAVLYGAEVIEKHFTLDKTLPGNDHYHAGDPNDFALAIRNFDLLEKINGSYKIDVFECERIPRREARRSLVLTRDIKKGEIIMQKDLMPKRPGTGISPEYINIVVGRKALQDMNEDEILTWDKI